MQDSPEEGTLLSSHKEGSRFAFMGRGPCTCCSRENLNRGPWTPEEDELLTAYIKRHGDRGNWRKVPKAAGLHRCGKSCRLRWLNYLRPDLKRGSFSEDEADLIIKLHSLLGNRWSIIAGRIPGRSDNEIKNYWNFHLSKKLLSMGINPKTHKPLNNNNNNSKLSSDSRSPRTSFSSSVSSEDLPWAELTWLDWNDNFVAMHSPAISNTSSPDEQQLCRSKKKLGVAHCSNDKVYHRNSSCSSITSPCSSQSNDTCGSAHNSASVENPNWIQSALDSFHVSNENDEMLEHNDNLVLSTMQQLQADLSTEQQQQQHHDGFFDLDFLEDSVLVESNDGLLEVLGCL